MALAGQSQAGHTFSLVGRIPEETADRLNVASQAKFVPSLIIASSGMGRDRNTRVAAAVEYERFCVLLEISAFATERRLAAIAQMRTTL